MSKPYQDLSTMIKFRAKIISSDRNKITKIIYSLICKDNKYQWILNKCGLSYMGIKELLKIQISQILRDQNIQKRDELICNSSNTVNYKIFKK
jgi:hypothetical protein